MNDKPLRVLHVLSELRPSGAEAMLVAAAPMFQSQGVVAEVLSTGAVPGPYAKRFEDAGYRIHHLPFSRTPGFFWRQRRVMQAGRYDVIHLHDEKANFWQGLTALSVRPPVVLRSIHGAFAFTGYLQWRRGWQRRLLHRLGLKHVSISDSVAATELRHYRLPTTLIYNWYDSVRLNATSPEARAAARSAFGLNDRVFVIASIGNCSQVKNHTAIIEAMARLPTAQRPVYLHAGIEEAAQPERDLAQRLGVSDHIRFLGGVDDVLPLLQAADAFVMPSLFEGFGVAAVEALATGLPALFTDSRGLRDFRSKFPGLVYTQADAESVTEGLQRLMSITEDERAAVLTTYPETASKLFGMARGVGEYLEVYRSVKRSM
jgi:glycosyltransferase involved in cell wall biosynthesis